MGRKSTREDKNIYQLSREAMDLTREEAAEKLQWMTADRIEKIEYGKKPDPDEVVLMAECYRAPALCNWYCTHECAIGQEYVPEVQVKDLSQITLEMLASLNEMTRERDRLIDITVDGEITPDEIPDFRKIQDTLEKMAVTITSLQLWVENTIADGKLCREDLEG